MGDDSLSSKQVGSQASRRVTRRLAWIQPVCISINAVPALKGLNITSFAICDFICENLLYGGTYSVILDQLFSHFLDSIHG